MVNIDLEEVGDGPFVDNSEVALFSIAISLKCIANCLEAPEPKQSANINALLWQIAERAGEMVNR